MQVAIKSRFIGGVHLPAQEAHMVEWMTTSRNRATVAGRLTYQWKKQQKARALLNEHVLNWRDGAFVDVGAHVGLWSMWWGHWNRKVIAFEPIDTFRALYAKNCIGLPCTMLPYALSDEEGEIAFRVDPKNTGGTRAYAPGEVHTFKPQVSLVKRLDDALPPVLGGLRMTVLKIDCEGYEEKVIRGGLEMIRKHRPLIVVEQKFEAENFGFEKGGALSLLKSEGYEIARSMGGDYALLPKR